MLPALRRENGSYRAGKAAIGAVLGPAFFGSAGGGHLLLPGLQEAGVLRGGSAGGGRRQHCPGPLSLLRPAP